MYTSAKSHDIHFHLLHEEDQHRVRVKYHCEKDDELVSRDDLVKGYEYEKGKYVIVEDEELERIKPESSSTLEIAKFIELSEVDPIYFESTYYLGPEEGTEKTFSLLQKAMANKKRAAVGKLFMRDHEYLALIRAANSSLILETMRFHDEIQKNQNKASKDLVREKELTLAEGIIDNLTGEWKPEEFEDEYIQRLEKMLEDKIHGRKVKQFKPKKTRTIPNLMEALQASVKQTQKKPVKQLKRSA
jgi:DNA end-binding protein Ku